ncbi:general substrate transporter [Dipodascopsis uninucleata]
MFKDGSIIPSILMGLFPAVCGILYGFDTGLISGVIAMKNFKKAYGTIDADGTPILSSSRQSLFVSIISAGLCIGALATGTIADRIGRRYSMICGCAIFTVGVIIQIAAVNVPGFVIGRFIAGLGAGQVSSTSPIYQAEVTPKHLRGTIMAAFHTSRAFGVFLSSVVNYAARNLSGMSCFRVPIGLQFVFSTVIVVCVLTVLPETPRYWIKKNEMDKARKSLSAIRHRKPNDPLIDQELNEIKVQLAYEDSIGKATFRDCFRRGNRQLHRTIMGMLIQALEQLVGVNFIKYFGTEFFQNAGIQNSFLISVLTNGVSVASTFSAMYFVERLGRRKLLFVGTIGCFATEYIVAIVGITTSSTIANRVMIAFTCLYLVFESGSIAPPGWVVVGESFPLKTRAKCISLSVATNFITNFAITFATPYLVGKGPGNADLGYKVFFIWGSAGLLMFVFVFTWVFETKGLSLEQVDECYNTIKYAWQSSRFVPSSTIEDGIAKQIAMRSNNGGFDEEKAIVAIVEDVARIS